jgi:hypothetical protein
MDKIIQKIQVIDDIAFNVNLVKNASSVSIAENVLLTRIYTGQLMYVDSRDVSVVPHLLMSGTWESEIAQLFREYVKAESVVFDIGSNTGFFGVIAGTHIDSGSIHFFEANPIWEGLLQKTLIVNGLDQISTINTNAVSDITGDTVNLYMCDDLWGSNSLHKNSTQSVVGNDWGKIIEQKIRSVQ